MLSCEHPCNVDTVKCISHYSLLTNATFIYDGMRSPPNPVVTGVNTDLATIPAIHVYKNACQFCTVSNMNQATSTSSCEFLASGVSDRYNAAT